MEEKESYGSATFLGFILSKCVCTEHILKTTGTFLVFGGLVFVLYRHK